MGPLSWIIFGGLAGWVASIIAGSDQRQGCLVNIIVGIIGAFLGGLIMQFINGGDPFNFTWNWQSFAVAVLGALVLLVITGATRRNRNPRT